MIYLIGFIGVILILAGLIGCVLPALPGPPLSFVAILLLALVERFQPPLTGWMMVFLFVIMLVATLLDYVIPAVGAKRYGGSKAGVWGSIAGMIVGIFFFPPFGILIGGFVGAVLFEWMGSRQTSQAFRAGGGVFIGTLWAIVVKLIASGVMTYYFFAALIG